MTGQVTVRHGRRRGVTNRASLTGTAVLRRTQSEFADEPKISSATPKASTATICGRCNGVILESPLPQQITTLDN
jgi:hypothetical protein